MDNFLLLTLQLFVAWNNSGYIIDLHDMRIIILEWLGTLRKEAEGDEDVKGYLKKFETFYGGA